MILLYPMHRRPPMSTPKNHHPPVETAAIATTRRIPSLGRRILASMIVVGLLPVILMSVENHLFSKKAIEDSENGHLGYALKSRLTFLEAWTHHTKKEFYYAAKSRCSVSACAGEKSDAFQRHSTCKTLQSVMRGHAVYDFLAVYDRNWEVIVTTAETKNSPLNAPPDNLKKHFASARDFVAGPFLFSEGRAILPICHPTTDESGNPLSYTVGYLDIRESLERILGKSSDIGETGRFVLLTEDGRYLWTPKDMESMVGTRAQIPESLYRGPFRKGTHYLDHTGTEVLGIAAPAEEGLPWILLAQIEKEEAYRILNKRMLAGISIGLVMLALIALVCVWLSRGLARPLGELARVAHTISSGRMKERVPEFSEQETREVGSAFNAMLDRLAASRLALSRSAALAAVGELSSSIAHEMRNPLSSITINLQAFAEKLKHDPVYAELSAISIQQAHRLETMLSDLLKYAAPIELHLEQTTFRQLVSGVLPLVEKEATNKQITIHVDDHLGQQPILLDRELMTRALTNLVDNAVQWSPAGGTIRVSGYPAPGAEDWASIRVRDNGPGIRPGQREKLFRLFYSTREDGHGIGLANVKKIIEYHDGFVAGDNAREREAVFSLLLPTGGPDN